MSNIDKEKLLEWLNSKNHMLNEKIEINLNKRNQFAIYLNGASKCIDEIIKRIENRTFDLEQ